MNDLQDFLKRAHACAVFGTPELLVHALLDVAQAATQEHAGIHHDAECPICTAVARLQFVVNEEFHDAR